MTRIKLDENLSRHLATSLIELGHEVTTAREEGLLGRDDREVGAAAAREARFVFSTIRYVIAPQIFGAACAGAAGTPDISVSGVPTLGGSVTIASTPSSAATSSLFLGFQDQSWLGIPLPLDLGLVGVAGCSIHVSLDIAL